MFEWTYELDEIVVDVQNDTGYIFSFFEIVDILNFTIRKCQINGKGKWYVPVLFENELYDYLMREDINSCSMI